METRDHFKNGGNRIFKLIGALFVGCVVLVGCSFEEIEVNGDANGKTKLVKRMLGRFEYGSSEEWIDLYWEFTYDDKQRITECFFTEGAWEDTNDITFSYDNNQVTMIISSSVDGETTTSTTKYSLNNNGFIISGNGNGINPLPFRNSFPPRSGYAIYEYSNGYISKANISSQTNTYTWENGNLIKIVEDFGDGTLCTRTRTYSSMGNVFCTDLFLFGVYDKYRGNELLGSFALREVNLMPAMTKGWTSKNLLVSETWSSREVIKSTTTYTYVFDSDGYPSKIIISFDKSIETFSYDIYY